MKYIYKVSQAISNWGGTYDSMIVVADNLEQASKIDPSGKHIWSEERECWMFVYSDGRMEAERSHGSWCHPKETIVELLGVTDLYNENKVILASFNAG